MSVNQLTRYTEYFLYACIVIFVVGIVGAVLYKKGHKVKSEKERADDYGYVKRKDSIDYVSCDNIIKDMIVDGNRYIGIIKCSGCNFFSMDVEEKLGIANGYLSFLNTVTTPIQKRIYAQTVDLERNIKMHEDAINENVKNLQEMYLDHRAIVSELQKPDELDAETFVEYREGLKILENNIKNKRWEIDHLAHLIEYMKELSGGNIEPVREDTYIIDWEFDPSRFPESITKDEIVNKANENIDAKLHQMIHALHAAGVTAKRVRGDELREMVRLHYHVWSANIFKADDVMNSDAEGEIVTSDSIEKLEQEFNEFLEREASVANEFESDMPEAVNV